MPLARGRRIDVLFIRPQAAGSDRIAFPVKRHLNKTKPEKKEKKWNSNKKPKKYSTCTIIYDYDSIGTNTKTGGRVDYIFFLDARGLIRKRVTRQSGRRPVYRKILSYRYGGNKEKKKE